MIDQNIIRQKLNNRLKSEKLSLRKIALETGVSFSTLGRISRNVGQADTETLLKIAEWLGIVNFSGGTVASGENTMENIRAVIEADGNLSAKNRTRIWKLFKQMYLALQGEK